MTNLSDRQVNDVRYLHLNTEAHDFKRYLLESKSCQKAAPPVVEKTTESANATEKSVATMTDKARTPRGLEATMFPRFTNESEDLGRK